MQVLLSDLGGMRMNLKDYKSHKGQIRKVKKFMNFNLINVLQKSWEFQQIGQMSLTALQYWIPPYTIRMYQKLR